MFAALDEDGSGDISIDEFLKGMDLNPELSEEMTNILGSTHYRRNVIESRSPD